jgi:hypothetical protein
LYSIAPSRVEISETMLSFSLDLMFMNFQLRF